MVRNEENTPGQITCFDSVPFIRSRVIGEKPTKVSLVCLGGTDGRDLQLDLGTTIHLKRRKRAVRRQTAPSLSLRLTSSTEAECLAQIR